MGRSVDWTLEDNMVDGLLFCATLAGRRGGHTPFVQAGAETSDTGAEAVEPDPGPSWEGHSGEGGYRCRELKCGVLWGCPSTPHSIGNPPTAPHVCCCCQMNWWVVVRRVQMGVSIWGAVHLHSLEGSWNAEWAYLHRHWLNLLNSKMALELFREPAKKNSNKKQQTSVSNNKKMSPNFSRNRRKSRTQLKMH